MLELSAFTDYNIPMYNIDKLYETVAARGHVCVGLDTAVEYVPEKEHCSTAAESVFAYNKAIIDATIDIAACYKLQIAYYEEMGIDGLRTYAETLKYLRNQGALAIADIKRGDIADTASRYARAHFEGDFEADFVTLNPYLGMDSVEPWLEWADKKGKGSFVLMRTSNKGSQDSQ
jgi:orotidine-5'-phosphate decarboxylase